MLNVNDNKEEFYSRFFDQLSQSQSWPGIYFFKFIVESESDNLSKLRSIFSAKKAFFFEWDPTILNLNLIYVAIF